MDEKKSVLKQARNKTPCFFIFLSVFEFRCDDDEREGDEREEEDNDTERENLCKSE